MFLFDWFHRILASLGLWQEEAKQMETRSLLLVLDNYGKETLSLMLGNEGLVQQDPTHLTSGEISIENIKFTVLDLGDHQVARRSLRDYHVKVDAVALMAGNPEVDADAVAFVVGGYRDSWLHCPRDFQLGYYDDCQLGSWRDFQLGYGDAWLASGDSWLGRCRLAYGDPRPAVRDHQSMLDPDPDSDPDPDPDPEQCIYGYLRLAYGERLVVEVRESRRRARGEMLLAHGEMFAVEVSTSERHALVANRVLPNVSFPILVRFAESEGKRVVSLLLNSLLSKGPELRHGAAEAIPEE